MQPGVIYNYPIDGNLGTAVVVDRDGVGGTAIAWLGVLVAWRPFSMIYSSSSSLFL